LADKTLPLIPQPLLPKGTKGKRHLEVFVELFIPNSIEFRADVTINEIPPNPPYQGGKPKPKAGGSIKAIFSV
jgi:hypothetical protein